MDFFNSSTPVYKTATAPKDATYAPSSQGWLSGLFGSLFTGATPSYKTAPPPVSTASTVDDTAGGSEADDACAGGSQPSETIVVL